MKSTSGSTTRARAKPTRWRMPPESSLGVGGFETVEANGIKHLFAAFAALGRVNASRLQRSFDVFKHRKPRKERETLENDGDVNLGLRDRLPMPIDLAGRGPRETGQHAQHGGLARSRRAQKRDDFARHNAQVGGRDHLDAVFARLGVVLLDLLSANDRVLPAPRSRGSVALFPACSISIGDPSGTATGFLFKSV